MDEREAIRELVSRFFLAFDAWDWSALRRCLADEDKGAGLGETQFRLPANSLGAGRPQAVPPTNRQSGRHRARRNGSRALRLHPDRYSRAGTSISVSSSTVTNSIEANGIAKSVVPKGGMKATQPPSCQIQATFTSWKT